MLNNQELQAIKNRYGIIGNDYSINYALSVASQVANTDLTVLIQGESGVGKEVFSQIIHSQSTRKHNSFIAINCGAIPEGTIDSELFGHEKGSFTSAVDSRKGYFETVNGGTIFLDEIGEMPIGTQARLLRVLETGEYIRVGSSKVQKTDVRIIAATNKDLLELVQIGKFREDLYYRLSTVPIRVAPLRERKNDIHLLFRKFCTDFSIKYKREPIQLTPDAVNLLISYRWPGNIRELKNMSEQMSVLAQNKIVDIDEIKRFIPENNEERLPMLIGAASQKSSNQGDFSNERDLLYQLFFDMKKDVTDVKKMFYEILKNPSMAQSFAAENATPYYDSSPSAIAQVDENDIDKPIIIQKHSNATMNVNVDANPVEDILDIAENEKRLIVRALKKHRGRRRNAASELGISERTLYRKIKEYDVEE